MAFTLVADGPDGGALLGVTSVTFNPLAGHNHPPRSERVKEIADRLRGTTGYNGDQDDIEDLTIEECKELDSQVFCCTACGWWCDGGECNEHEGEWVCDECMEEKGVDP